jgi:hypothetical protein
VNAEGACCLSRHSKASKSPMAYWQ